MDQGAGLGPRLVHPRYCIRGGLYQKDLQIPRLAGDPGNPTRAAFPTNVRFVPAIPDPIITAIQACNWTNGLGPAKLIPTTTPQIPTAQINGLQDIQQTPFIATDGFIQGQMAKDGMFGTVNDPKLGPVEKAVLHQAMYNQSKKLTPEMRRCDDCNVIFNSQNQAEMHYKGKKHAKVMFLKRNREAKRSTTDSTGTGVEYQPSESVSVDAIRSDTNTLLPNEIGPRYSNECKTELSHDRNLLASDTVQNSSQQTEIREMSEDQLTPQSSAITNTASKVDGEFDGSAISEERTSQSSYDVTDNQDNKIEEGTTIAPREPVVLPDPLPRYISRIEKPTVLKESLRCTVCDIYVNSENQMRQHVNSLRHKNIEKGIPTPPKPVKEDKPKGRSEQFRCEICRVTLNSDIQLLQHLSSQRHRNMLDGKPPKPRWTPYERTQHALLRSAAHLRLSTIKSIPNGGSPIILSPTISSAVSPLSLVPHHQSLGSPVIAQAPTPTHLKQMAYITPNGGILQAQEIVYVGAPAPNFTSHHQPQPSHQIPTTAATLLQTSISGIPHELPSFLSGPCAGLDQREFGFNWSPGI